MRSFFPLYAFFAGGKIGVKQMLKYIFTPTVTAFAAQSSAATCPNVSGGAIVSMMAARTAEGRAWLGKALQQRPIYY